MQYVEITKIKYDIRKEMKKEGVGFKKLASLTGLNVQKLYRILKNDGQDMYLSDVIVIYRALGMDFCGVDRNKKMREVKEIAKSISDMFE